jgi:hypothetical protein
MTDTSRAAFVQARQCWPERGQDERILAPARQIYDEWQAASPDTRRIALDAALASGLTRLPGRDSARAQCRDLTLFGSPLPGPHATLRPLTVEQVEALGVVPPSTDRSRRASVPPVRATSAPPPSRRGRGNQTPRAATPAIVLAAADSKEAPPAPEDPPSSDDGGGHQRGVSTAAANDRFHGPVPRPMNPPLRPRQRISGWRNWSA